LGPSVSATEGGCGPSHDKAEPDKSRGGRWKTKKSHSWAGEPTIVGSAPAFGGANQTARAAEVLNQKKVGEVETVDVKGKPD